jgi:uncharacterized protein YukE
MSQIGISPDEALHLVSQQGALTDALRNLISRVENHVNSLAGATYCSETTQALRAKFEGETKPQFQRIIARSEDAQNATVSCVNMQMATQGDGAGKLNAI